MSSKFIDSLNQGKPSAEAKARMLENILQNSRRTNKMGKKIISVASIAAVLAIAIFTANFIVVFNNPETSSSSILAGSNFFSIVAYAADGTSLGEIISSDTVKIDTNANKKRLHIDTGENAQMGIMEQIALEVNGENIENVSLSANNCAFIKATDLENSSKNIDFQSAVNESITVAPDERIFVLTTVQDGEKLSDIVVKVVVTYKDGTTENREFTL